MEEDEAENRNKINENIDGQLPDVDFDLPIATELTTKQSEKSVVPSENQCEDVEKTKNVEKAPSNWFTDHAQLVYISECTNNKTIPSGYFLRNLDKEVLSLRHCVLGPQRIRPICVCMCTNITITKLDLTDTWLCDECVPDLVLMFKENTMITDVNLSENQLTSKCAENLCDVLASSTQLERIDLHGNRFEDASGTYFADLMATSLRLAYLNLSYNHFGEQSTIHFGRALPQATSIVELDLSWNRLGTGGLRQFGKGLSENKYLKILNFAANGLGPRRGCPEFATALRQNKTLESLNLSDNRIGPEGAVLLCKGLYTNTTLKYLSLARNPMQTAGCFAMLTGILRNANCNLCELDLQDITVNQDFRELQDTARIKLPKLTVRAGRATTERTRALSPKFNEPDRSPKEILQIMGRTTGIRLADMLRPHDTVGDKVVTRQAFIKVLPIYMSKVGIDFTEEQMKALMLELDPKNEEEINFKDFE